MLLWSLWPAMAAPPPSDWSALAKANPGLTLVLLGEESRALAEGWTDNILVLLPGTELSQALQRLDASGCAVIALGGEEGWTLMPSPSCRPAGTPEPPQGETVPPVPQTEPALQTEPVLQTELALEPEGEEDSVEPVTGRIDTDGGLLAYGLIYGGYTGAETGWLIGEATERDEQAHKTTGLWPGLLGGSIVGLSTTLILDRSRSLSPPAEAMLFNSTSHGLFYGVQLGRALIGPDAPGAEERIHAAGLGGSMLGAGLAVAFGDSAAPIDNQIRFGLATGVGWVTATGISDLAGLGLRRDDTNNDGVPEAYRYDQRPRAAIALGTAAAFGGLGTIGNRLTQPGPAAIGLSIGHGIWLGGWSPLLFGDDPTAREVSGGLRLGLGAGYASALLLGAAGEPNPTSIGLQVAGWAAASALGAGIPLSLRGEGPAAVVVGPMLLSGIGGQVLGGVIAPHYELDLEDGLLIGTLGAWTSYQAVGWGVYASYTTEEARRPFGYALAAGGTGTLITIAMAPLLDVPPAGSLVLLSSGGWGTWYGAWSAELADLSDEDAWLVTLASGNGTLLVSGVAQGIGWKPDWADLASIDGLGLIGTAAGGLVGVIFLYDPENLDPLVISTLIGTTAGLAGGGYFAATGEGGPVMLRSLSLPHLRANFSVLPLPSRKGNDGIYIRLDVREGR